MNAKKLRKPSKEAISCFYWMKEKNCLTFFYYSKHANKSKHFQSNQLIN